MGPTACQDYILTDHHITRYFCISCAEKTSCSTTYVWPIIYGAHNYIIPRVAYSRLIYSRQHRSYLLVPGVLEVPGDPLFHLYRPYLKKNRTMLKLRKNLQQKRATCFSIFLQIELQSYVAQLPPTFKPVLQQIRLIRGW